VFGVGGVVHLCFVRVSVLYLVLYAMQHTNGRCVLCVSCVASRRWHHATFGRGLGRPAWQDTWDLN
jgi:hypothetical protein